MTLQKLNNSNFQGIFICNGAKHIHLSYKYNLLFVIPFSVCSEVWPEKKVKYIVLVYNAQI